MTLAEVTVDSLARERESETSHITLDMILYLITPKHITISKSIA
jgi:hypothetical protein